MRLGQREHRIDDRALRFGACNERFRCRHRRDVVGGRGFAPRAPHIGAMPHTSKVSRDANEPRPQRAVIVGRMLGGDEPRIVREVRTARVVEQGARQATQPRKLSG
jgi:hypothetical protein